MIVEEIQVAGPPHGHAYAFWLDFEGTDKHHHRGYLDLPPREVHGFNPNETSSWPIGTLAVTKGGNIFTKIQMGGGLHDNGIWRKSGVDPHLHAAHHPTHIW